MKTIRSIFDNNGKMIRRVEGDDRTVYMEYDYDKIAAEIIAEVEKMMDIPIHQEGLAIIRISCADWLQFKKENGVKP